MVTAKYPAYKNQDKKRLIAVWSAFIVNLTYEQVKLGCEWIISTDVKYFTDVMRGFKLACFGLVSNDKAYQIAKDIKAGEVEDGKHAVIREAMGRAGMFSKVSTRLTSIFAIR